MNQITLKRATEANQSEIATFERKADSKTYSARLGPKEIKNFIKDSAVFLIKKGRLTVGIVAYEVTGKNQAHINSLVICPKYQGRGFARQAIKQLLKKLNQFTQVDLVVHPHNSLAIALYLEFGFTIKAWKNNYFGDGEPRLILELRRRHKS